VSTDVTEENIASIFSVEKISSARNQCESRWQAGVRKMAEVNIDKIQDNGLLGCDAQSGTADTY
jgi:hypothetical protein